MAEFEYLRLFEQERLSNNTASAENFDSPITRSSSADVSTNAKVEQMLEHFGLTIDPQVFQPASLLNGHDTQEAGSASDSDSNTTTTNPSIVDTTLPLSKSPPSFAPLASLPMDPRHLMLALSQLNHFNQELRHNQSASNLTHTKTAMVDQLPSAGDDKEKQSLISPTIKRPLEDNENLMKMFTKKKRMNGIFGNQNIDEKWRREMFEVRTGDNFSTILSVNISASAANSRQSRKDLGTFQPQTRRRRRLLGNRKKARKAL